MTHISRKKILSFGLQLLRDEIDMLIVEVDKVESGEPERIPPHGYIQIAASPKRASELQRKIAAPAKPPEPQRKTAGVHWTQDPKNRKRMLAQVALLRGLKEKKNAKNKGQTRVKRASKAIAIKSAIHPAAEDAGKVRRRISAAV